MNEYYDNYVKVNGQRKININTFNKYNHFCLLVDTGHGVIQAHKISGSHNDIYDTIVRVRASMKERYI